MKFVQTKKIGFTCAYTPLSLIDAAGFEPFRILPIGNAMEKENTLLHDNICPHVKQILHRALVDNIPDLAGVVFMNSCDTMRRLADAWIQVRPEDPVAVVDLPAVVTKENVLYFSGELRRLAAILAEWSGLELTEERINASIGRYDELSTAILKLDEEMRQRGIQHGGRIMQEIYNTSVTESLEITMAEIEKHRSSLSSDTTLSKGVPVYLFGNVLPDPEAIALFESCGASIVGDDLCTGFRVHAPMGFNRDEDVFVGLSRGLLNRQRCARTFSEEKPGDLSRQLVERVHQSGAKGVITHVMKFCDPYLARMPFIQEALKQAEIPLLMLSGDCTLRSLGQFQTRIEAFVEMLR